MKLHCLYCGKQLRQVIRSNWRDMTDDERAYAAELDREYHARLATIDRQYREDEIEESARGRLTKAAQADRDRKFRKRFNVELRHQQVQVRTPTGKYGDGGQGLFHSQRCGYLFGVAAAHAGYRRGKA